MSDCKNSWFPRVLNPIKIINFYSLNPNGNLKKKKRNLVVDYVTILPAEVIKAQLADTSNILAAIDVTPPTRRLMHFRETSGAEKSFGNPGHVIPSRKLSNLFRRHLTMQEVPDDVLLKRPGDDILLTA